MVPDENTSYPCLLKLVLSRFHEIKQEEEAERSYCRKEGCWSEQSDCIELKALERFLNEECVTSDSLSSRRL
jgi:hypothetical protein